MHFRKAYLDGMNKFGTNDLSELLTSVRFDEAEILCKDMKTEEIAHLLLESAYKTESITVYGFAMYMKERHDKKTWLNIMFDLMINPLCFIEGAYALAAVHARELIGIEESVENLEKLLFIYNSPENVISEKEAKIAAVKMLKIEPQNTAALEVLGLMESM